MTFAFARRGALALLLASGLSGCAGLVPAVGGDFRYEDRPETTGMPYRFNPRDREFSSSRSAVLEEIARLFREQPAIDE